ncbi:type III secretion protein [Escherichia coli]|uniref:type III secretion protein n=1 Tax=Escherichia coli TaxID=562 RepID=UPI001D13F0A1|nr:type III secretion protein [Escherichia coli]EIG1887031.1 type III secretion protein [Escherichia coli]HEI2790266.1 type III secretion protein [Escherichia coli]HEI3621604.1 type III secretion protein [Escherichia coli]HEI3671916.1 type III secretion protein [Escherichia coli]HEI4217062.1 type III secretion protein [Escherichia coli]
MRTKDSHIISILYAPARYTHHSHLPEIFQSSEIREDTLLNFWLLKHGELSDLPTKWQPDDVTFSLLISRWHHLPIVAHLIGGYLLRNRLPEMSAALMTDSRLLAFASLPLLHQLALDETNAPLDTISYGVTFIMGQFPELPIALRQRLMLHFPSNMTLAQFSAPKTPNHFNLLRMAFNYAHHYY